MTDTNLPLDGAALPAENIESLRARVAELLAHNVVTELIAEEAEADKRVAELKARVAELEQERDACGRLAAEQGVTANALRDALEDVLLNRDCACYEDGEPNCCDVCAARYADAAKTIATTPRASLAAYRASVLEEAAHIAHNWCLVPPDGGAPTAEEAALCEGLWKHFRALAAQDAAVERAEREDK